MADILVYSEKRDTARELTFKAKEFAGALGLGVSAAALGASAREAAAELGAHGADTVYLSEDPALEGLQTDVVAEALAQIVHAAEATCVLVGSTRRGKELASRLAQKLGAGCVTDVGSMAVEDGALVAGRYAFGGNTVARETVITAAKVFAVMPKAFEIGAPVSGVGAVVTPSLELTPSAVTVVDRRPKEGETVDLAAANRIVGMGRGFDKREDLALGEQLADALKAELGATKGIADFQWVSEDRVIGLSGAKTSPELYVAVGISGQIQHTVGISSAKLIVAVNKDKDAPIFQLADYGIVGNLYDVLPALIEKLKA